jgi:hypothetical protein
MRGETTAREIREEGGSRGGVVLDLHLENGGGWEMEDDEGLTQWGGE